MPRAPRLSNPLRSFEHVGHVVARTMRAVGEIEHKRNQNMHNQFQGRLHTLAKPKRPNIQDAHDRMRRR